MKKLTRQEIVDAIVNDCVQSVVQQVEDGDLTWVRETYTHGQEPIGDMMNSDLLAEYERRFDWGVELVTKYEIKQHPESNILLVAVNLSDKSNVLAAHPDLDIGTVWCEDELQIKALSGAKGGYMVTPKEWGNLVD